MQFHLSSALVTLPTVQRVLQYILFPYTSINAQIYAVSEVISYGLYFIMNGWNL